ncbi:ATP-dependent DNA helicase RecG-like protein [Desulfotignum phosphitoxidans DSM 13687]|uniref:ATP-dependent DNA helicase RecG-like protein n=2 Tax=Desulfotignum phosphitoxidans TaxID=190898 RepID=S0G0Q4_9BACT|nr:ATP-dependent DNA helicase RecG-like protein [Desulfotignum phosphitoxidans DSM 13687]
MYKALLMEGKEPPVIQEIGESVCVTFLKREMAAAFRVFVAQESRKGNDLGVDTLLILQYLLKHPELETSVAAGMCQRSQGQMREILSAMEKAGYIEHGGAGRGMYWTLYPELYQRLAESAQPERERRIDWDAAKTRILSFFDQARANRLAMNIDRVNLSIK